MKKNQALPGQFLAKTDFDQPVLAKIKKVVMEGIKDKDGSMEQKPILYLSWASETALDLTRGVVLNVGNWDACEAISGRPDSDDWAGVEIVIFNDPNVMFGSQRTGGIRIRAPRGSAPEPIQPPIPNDDVPF